MRHRTPTRFLVAILAAAVAAVPAVAQVTGDPASKPGDQETVVRLTVSPAATPDPAFRYTLVPQATEQVPGTAAPLYLNANDLLPEKITFGEKERDFRDVIDEIGDKPPADLKTTDITNAVAQSGALNLLWQASLRSRAEWSTTLRQEGFQALLPYLNHMRGTANFLATRGRVCLANGDMDGALRSARMLFTLSRHLGEDAVLIQALVGTGIGEVGLSKLLEDVVQSPASPNLYWALADLPRPMFDMREAMAWEKVAIRASLAPLRTGRSPEELGPGEWDQVTRDFSRILMSLPGGTRQNQLAATGLAVVYFPKAKRQLIARGIPAETVNNMPPTQVIGMSMLHTYDHWIDEMAKWSRLPYWQVAKAIDETSKAIESGSMADPINPAYMVIPAVGRAYATLTRLDRHVAALQTVEAIRAHAAANSGKLPASLEQVMDTPAPIDPTTGKTFAYKVTGDATAEISSPPVLAGRKATGLRYVITIRK